MCCEFIIRTGEKLIFPPKNIGKIIFGLNNPKMPKSIFKKQKWRAKNT